MGKRYHQSLPPHRFGPVIEMPYAYDPNPPRLRGAKTERRSEEERRAGS